MTVIPTAVSFALLDISGRLADTVDWTGIEKRHRMIFVFAVLPVMFPLFRLDVELLVVGKPLDMALIAGLAKSEGVSHVIKFIP